MAPDAVNVNQLTVVNNKIAAVQSDVLLWDQTAKSGVGAYSASHGGSPGQLTNVASGDVAIGSSDAINGAQLFALSGDTSTAYITNNGGGIRYARTNDQGLPSEDAHASAVGASALGYAATASAADSLALGRGALSNQSNSVALGAGSVTTLGAESNYQAFGSFVTTSSAGEVSLGSAGLERKITNLAAGSRPTDAVNVSQLSAVYDEFSERVDNAMLWDASQNGGRGGYDAGYNPVTKTFGVEKIVNLAAGDVNATSTDAINGAQLFQVAGDVSTSYTNTNGIGVRYVRTNEQGLLADDAYASGIGSTAVGYRAAATADNALALGYGTTASHAGSVALGANAITTLSAETGYAAYALTAPQNSVGEVSIGALGSERKISNLAAGVLDTDAVNVAQLKVVNTNIDILRGDSLLWDGNAKAGAGAFSASHGGVAGNVITNVAAGDVNASSTRCHQWRATVRGDRRHPRRLPHQQWQRRQVRTHQ